MEISRQTFSFLPGDAVWLTNIAPARKEVFSQSVGSPKNNSRMACFAGKPFSRSEIKAIDDRYAFSDEKGGQDSSTRVLALADTSIYNKLKEKS